MGEPVTVVQKESSRPGYLRFETNRTFTGMGHESYKRGDEIYTDRPPDLIARAMFETGDVEEVHLYAQAVTMKVAANADVPRIKKILEDIHIYYLPGVEVPTPESFGAEG